MADLEQKIESWPSEIASGTTSFQLVPFNLFSTATFDNEINPGGTVDQRFVAKMTFPPKTTLVWREASGIISRLRGIYGRVRMYDPLRRIPAYNIRVMSEQHGFSDGTNWSDDTGWLEGFLPPLVSIVDPAKRGDRSIVVQGYPASEDKVHSPGDLFEIRPNGVAASHGHCYEVVRYSNSDADGKTRIEFEPGLRANVASGDQVVLRDPTTVFRLASDQEGEITRSIAHYGEFGLSLIEIPIPLPGREFGQ